MRIHRDGGNLAELVQNGKTIASAKPLTIVTAGDAFMVQRFPKGYSIAPELAGWIGSGDARLVNFEAVVNDGSCPPNAWSGGTWASYGTEIRLREDGLLEACRR